jgi:ZIP family zinc transporter
MEPKVLFAFGLTAFAGLATGIGSLIAFLAKRTNKKFLSVALGFSAGVMLYVSLVEILVKAKDALAEERTEATGWLYAIPAFFAGMLLIMVIDLLIPSPENPHSLHSVEEMKDPAAKEKHLLRMGMFTALAIAIHNFPEGLATFAGALANPALGVSIAIAIAIHNVPEGISVSVPIYFATGSKKKAFWLSFLSGVSEPVGALIGYTILRSVFSNNTFGILFASVAGIMVYVSLDELLPAAREHGTGHLAICGVMAGMAVIAASLVVFKYV